MKLLFPFLFFLMSVACPGQENPTRGTIKVDRNDCTLVKGNDSVYSQVDKMPEFPGGQEKMLKWLKENLKYPSSGKSVYAAENSSATIFTSFIVEKTGEIGEVTVFKSDNSPFEMEALRLIRLMPKWEPGLCDDEQVAVKVNYPIRFGLR